MVRRSGGDFAPGPRVALIQGDFKCELEHDESTWVEIQRTHERLTGEAVIGKPQLVVWPETMFRWPLVETPPDMTDGELQRAHPNWSIAHLKDPNIAKRLSDLAQMGQTGLMVGLTGIELDQDSADAICIAYAAQKAYARALQDNPPA
jgi:apolipoprotein N-acyltransferase